MIHERLRRLRSDLEMVIGEETLWLSISLERFEVILREVLERRRVQLQLETRT